jgi:predicted transcriptional regulator
MESNSNNSLAENKVLILYLLNKLDKDITNDGLYKLMSSVNGLNYFYFQQTLSDLLNSNFVGSYTKDEETVIKITSEGKNAFNLTKDILPGLVKLKADSIFNKELASIEEEASITAEFTPKNENEYTVRCKISENNETIFEVKTFAGSRERAKTIVENWKNNASTIYPKILDLLLDENKD